MKLTKTIQCGPCRGTGKQFLADHKAMRKRREAKGLSMRAMARRIKRSAPFLSDIENGKRACPSYVLKAYEKL